MICYRLPLVSDGIFESSKKLIKLKTYLIQRNIPGIGKSNAATRKTIARKSCDVLQQLGPEIEWQHSFVTADNLWCIYKSEDIELIREHAKRGNFPLNAIHEIVGVISPATAELVPNVLLD